MSRNVRQQFDRDLKSLDAVSRFVEGFIDQSAVDSNIGFSIDLAVEELFTNMVKYNPNGPSAIEIGLSTNGSRVEVVMVDAHSPRFDPREHRPPDVRAALRDRKPGGLGLMLVQRLMDEIHYEHENHRSQITLVKNL